MKNCHWNIGSKFTFDCIIDTCEDKATSIALAPSMTERPIAENENQTKQKKNPKKNQFWKSVGKTNL